MNITNKKNINKVTQLTQKQWYKTNSDTINEQSSGLAALLFFFVTPFKIDQAKNQIRSID